MVLCSGGGSCCGNSSCSGSFGISRRGDISSRVGASYHITLPKTHCTSHISNLFDLVQSTSKQSPDKIGPHRHPKSENHKSKVKLTNFPAHIAPLYCLHESQLPKQSTNGKQSGENESRGEQERERKKKEKQFKVNALSKPNCR